jgi:hypothetical protein
MGVTHAVRLGADRRRLSEAEIYDLLQNDRRRRTLLCLRERAGAVSLRALSEFVAGLETGERPPPEDCRESVYNSLHQTHLPKLVDLDVVAYDEESNRVTLTTNAREVDRFLRVRGSWGLSAGEGYQLLAVTSLLTALLAELDAPVLGSLDTLLVLTVALGTFGVVAALQAWRRRWIYLRSFGL